MIAAQFGFAMMPRWPAIVSGLISGTTSGTAASMRNAEELSTTIAPRAVAMGAYLRDVEPPAEKSARSTPSNELSFSSVTVTDPPANGSFLPADRADASARTLECGKRRFSRQLRISTPTAPVAPTTAMTGLAGIRRAPAAGADDIDTSPNTVGPGWRGPKNKRPRRLSGGASRDSRSDLGVNQRVPQEPHRWAS